MSERGRMIVIYGVNNTGKSTQIDLLLPSLEKAHKVECIKFPIYDLEPYGPILDGYLRRNNPFELSSREAQLIYVLNRLQFEPILRQKLDEGIWIVAEDYIGTGLAWGEDEQLPFLELVNSCLLKEDTPILLDGDRFLDSIEKDHKHEDDPEKIAPLRKKFLFLAEKFGWLVVNVVKDEEERIHLDICEKIMLSLKAEIPPA